MNSEPELIELLGKDTALKLEQELGGQRKYIASNPSRHSPIVAVIGMDAARKMASRFGGMLLYIPQHLAARMRNREILLAVWAGEHKKVIGQRFGLVERTIRKVVQGDNHPRFGLHCRRLRAAVQGYFQVRSVLEHRVNELESTPPRVNSLEHTVTQLEVQFTALNKDLGEIKEEGKETHSLVQQLGEDVRRLFFIGTLLAGVASALLVGLKIYDTWTGIQERQGSQPHTQGKAGKRHG